MRLRRRHTVGRKPGADHESRREAASILRRYRRLFRQAGYRVIGPRIMHGHAGIPAEGSVGTYDGARIVGVTFREEGAPRLVLSWEKPRRSRKAVHIAVEAHGAA